MTPIILTWHGFFLTLGIIYPLYYGIIAFLFYRQDLKRLLRRRRPAHHPENTHSEP